MKDHSARLERRRNPHSRSIHLTGVKALLALAIIFVLVMEVSP